MSCLTRSASFALDREAHQPIPRRQTRPVAVVLQCCEQCVEQFVRNSFRDPRAISALGFILEVIHRIVVSMAAAGPPRAIQGKQVPRIGPVPSSM